MLTRPPELSDAQLVTDLHDRWGVDVTRIDYAPVGFGSHHWLVTADDRRWFVTVDDLDARRWSSDEPRDAVFDRLDAALSTARTLSSLGLSFVIAPSPTTNGETLHRLDDRFVVALYPHVEGWTHAFHDLWKRGDRSAVLQLLIELHAVPLARVPAARRDEHVTECRSDLITALSELDEPWTAGPFAERTRALLRHEATSIGAMLTRFDSLVGQATARSDRLVLTHGEPHIGNTIQIDDGGWLLIDWDTTLIAPPERDLWMLSRGDEQILDEYAGATGRAIMPSALDLYRLSWDLAEIGLYSSAFRQPHDDTADTRESFENLRTSIESGRRQTGSTDRI